MSRRQVRSKSIKRAKMNGLYFAAETKFDEMDVLRAVCRKYPRAWVSYYSAARVHGLWIPRELPQDQIHVSVEYPHSRIRRAGLVSHESRNSRNLIDLGPLRITSPARTVMDLARFLSTDDLTALIDQLIRLPRLAFEGIERPLMTLAEWNSELDTFHGTGKKKLVVATKQARIGSDSRAESLLRLEIIRSGLPEPELQLTFGHMGIPGFSADMGYKKLRIAVHYDGRDHRNATQHHGDNSRDYYLEKAGWRNLRCSAVDFNEGFKTFCQRLRLVIEERRTELMVAA